MRAAAVVNIINYYFGLKTQHRLTFTGFSPGLQHSTGSTRKKPNGNAGGLRSLSALQPSQKGGEERPEPRSLGSNGGASGLIWRME